MRPTPARVVFILSRYAVGGAEKQLAALIERRPESARSLEIHTITFELPESAGINTRFRNLGVINTLVDRAALGSAAFLFQLVRTVSRLRPDAVHTFLDGSAGTWGRLAALLTRVPAVLHSDRLLAVGDTRAHRILRPHLDRRTHRFLPNAQAIADRLEATGISPAKISVMRNGVDLRVFRPRPQAPARVAREIPPEAVVAGFMGRFADQKRIDLMLQALVSLPEDRRPDLLLLAGDGPNRQTISAIVAEDPWLSQHVRFLGTVQDVPDFMASIDYLVLSSDSEGLPNVVLEAMAMARPVVATAVSDVPLLIGTTGFLAEPGNVLSVADAIAKMQALSPEERQELGLDARRKVEEENDIDKVAERFWEAHLELLPRTSEEAQR